MTNIGKKLISFLLLTILLVSILCFASCEEKSNITTGTSSSNRNDLPQENEEETIDSSDYLVFERIVGGYYINGLNEKGRYQAEIGIPDEYKGRPVIGISDYAFAGYNNLKKLIVGNNVKEIGNGAFSYCFELETIKLGKNVGVIGESIFRGCSIKELIVDKDNKKYVSKNNCVIEKSTRTLVCGCASSVIPDDGSVNKIGAKAFRECYGLINVVIPDVVTTIEEEAFTVCLDLVSVTLGYGLESIGERAFDTCVSLVEICNNSLISLAIGDESNGKIAMFAKNIYGKNWGQSILKTTQDGYIVYQEGKDVVCVKYVGNEENVVIPNDVTKINNYCIPPLLRKIKTLTIPGSLVEIGDFAFQAAQIEAITIEEGVRVIGESAFAGNLYLKEITLPESVSVIKGGAFTECTSLTTVVLPNYVSIGDYAFSQCESLTEIVFNNSIDVWNIVPKGLNWDDSTGNYTIICTDGKISK